jgi:hemoglobin
MIEYDLILKVIYSFYDKAKRDVMIGYHFRVIDDFDEHIPRIADFWNLQINGEMKNRKHLPFNLFDTHKPLKINTGEIFRWNKLFEDTLEEYRKENKLTEEQISAWMKKVKIFKERLVQLL